MVGRSLGKNLSGGERRSASIAGCAGNFAAIAENLIGKSVKIVENRADNTTLIHTSRGIYDCLLWQVKAAYLDQLAGQMFLWRVQLLSRQVYGIIDIHLKKRENPDGKNHQSSYGLCTFSRA
jgi:hypothetical protein